MNHEEFDAAAANEAKTEPLQSSWRHFRRTKSSEAPAPSENQNGVQDPFLGRVLDGRYQVLRRIARGGMATVYAGHDERLDRPVAIKIMHPHLAESADLVARFRREARATARLTHPGIVAVYDQGLIDGCGYLVMELVPGRNLRQELQARGSFTVAEALSTISQVLAALSIAHASGLIHRDIKPENVLLSESDTYKVADFGLARAVSDVTVATTGSVLGTVAYLAPEVITGGESDDRTDLYSVGIMLYELLAGRPPYSGATPIHVAYSHVHEALPALHETIAWMPEQIDTLIGCLAASEQAERPMNAADALALVTTVQASLPPEILQRRHEVEPVALPVAATEATGIGATAPMNYGHTTASLPTDAVHRRKRLKERSRLGAVALAVIAAIALLVAGITWYFTLGPGAYIKVPDVSGMSVAEASEVANSNGLSVSVQEQNHDDIRAGIVISTKPEAGGSVAKQGELVLVVSKGVLQVEVPDIRGKTYAEGKRLLQDAQLGVAPAKEEYSDDVKAGQVIGTRPEKGSTVRHDTLVEVLVSKGREPVKAPNLVGQTSAAAGRLVSEAGLKAKTTDAFSDDVKVGSVISQQPKAGEKMLRGDTISYVISKGPDLREVPRVAGLSTEEARQKLEAAGFKVEIRKMALGFNPNRVYAQDPGPGQMLKAGGTVVLYYV